MISGVFYKGADIRVELQTEVYIDTESFSAYILAKFPDGTVIEYEAGVADFSTVTTTIPAANNTLAGEIFLQAKLVNGDLSYVGETESLVIFDPFVVPP